MYILQSEHRRVEKNAYKLQLNYSCKIHLLCILVIRPDDGQLFLAETCSPFFLDIMLC